MLGLNCYTAVEVVWLLNCFSDWFGIVMGVRQTIRVLVLPSLRACNRHRTLEKERTAVIACYWLASFLPFVHCGAVSYLPCPSAMLPWLGNIWLWSELSIKYDSKETFPSLICPVGVEYFVSTVRKWARQWITQSGIIYLFTNLAQHHDRL